MPISLTSSKIAPQGAAQLGLSKKGPALFWTLTEGARASVELSSFIALRRLMRRLPKGDGHPVIFFPGFVASDFSTRPMRKLFDRLGYRTLGWGMGRNLVFNDLREAQMNTLVKEAFEKYGQKISLVGWSLGGVFAREIAKSNPDIIRTVISLGSPISGEMEHSNARRLYQALNGKPDSNFRARLATISQAPPVPTTSIYTKTDGIVAWKGSIQRPGKTPSENICIPASHIGLGVNPLVMYALADRLAQPEDKWTPFEAKGLKKFVFR